MKNNSFLWIVSTCLFSSAALAGTMGPIIQPPDWAWVATLSLGAAWEDAGRTQTIFLTPTIEKTYVANHTTNALFDGEIFLGIQETLSQLLQGQLGLAVDATSNADLSGVIWDDANPEFNNFIYRYKIQHTHVAVKGKLLADAGFWAMPWVSASIGVGFNYAHSFNNIPTIFEAVHTPNFGSNTETSFTYTVGAGLQKALNLHWQVGIGYEFADWGKNRLGRVAGLTSNNGPGFNHLYTNGFLVNLTYLA